MPWRGAISSHLINSIMMCSDLQIVHWQKFMVQVNHGIGAAVCLLQSTIRLNPSASDIIAPRKHRRMKVGAIFSEQAAVSLWGGVHRLV